MPRHPAAAPQPVALDPCTLGRPFHLLEEFHQRLGRQLARHLGVRFNHRQGANFSVGAVSIGSRTSGQGELPWRSYGAGEGVLSVRLERRLLLAMLGYHYGDRDGMRIDESAPETETEQRFGAATGLALLDVLRHCIDPAGTGEFTPRPLHVPGMGDRVIRVQIREPKLELDGRLEFAVDESWLDTMFATVAPRRAAAPSAAKSDVPLGRRLPITLTARILSKQCLLDELLGLSAGDVLPVRMPDTADVLAGDTLLYRAAVVEHGGTLCLTSFEHIE